ncbi:MBL fold metallo-hydrolase [Sphingomonas sp. ABOLE]|uniref:MBL fold metallo-hydrolase n=1 Tax=Sphingomonas sp. ABOLE TaxID=1985878 RepID=UPI000F7DBC04|nr:MBL fold metallo-hydrolase [Sphingomonas sp. ABOLE]RSV41201.1 MBL fold metallo-hydrolase [Sphingomonas sp. ABOLE]
MASTATATTAPLQVYVRMYRALQQGATYKGMLGDCFLLRLVQGDRTSHILIDCGLLLGSADADARMKTIAADIVQTSGGVLDLLVVTHEHWDHISGFSQARDVFLGAADPETGAETLEIAHLWMGWTEKDGDPQVQRLRERFDKTGAALSALAERIAQDPASPAAAAAAQTVGLQGFRGAASNGAKRLQGREIMAALKGKSKAPPQFLEPGTVLPTPAAKPGGPALRAYVLGPPRDEEFLFKDKPSSGKAQETYLTDLQLSDEILRFAQGGDLGSGTDTPFAPQYRTLPVADVEQGTLDSDDAAWLAARYFGNESTQKSDPALYKMNARRRIDADWLGIADPLALKLDSDTNNTSLALAFDLPDGTSMVFAADAQVGNWLSWHEQSYRDETGTEHSAEQILNRTRFYKVGHHGSHNATLDEKGLAMMTRDDLVAAVPTDEEFGKRQGSSGWQMPNPRVKAALRARTRDRILRNDRHYDAASRAADPELADVDADFLARITETDLYLEYRVL